MRNEKNNGRLITLLVVIITILAVLCVLFATDIISFKNMNNKEVNDSSNNVVGYYQFYKEYEDNAYTAYQLELNEDGTAKYCVVKANSGSFCDEGTYTVSNNKIYFDGKSVSGIAIGNPVTITFIKENDTIYEELSKVYTMIKTSKENMKNLFSQSTNTDNNYELYSLPLNNNPVTRAIFKIYQISEVYVTTFVDETTQCGTRKIIIYNSHGMTLKELDLVNASIDIIDDTITIKYDKTCRSVSVDDNFGTIKYQVVGASIIEK